MRDQSTAAERYRAIGVRQREGWVDQHIQDFVAGLIRHGFDVGLAALTQDVLRQKPASGAVFAFRGRRGDRIKLLFWDGQGFCLYYKVLERGRFVWPSAQDGAVRLTSAQLAMLWEGIDWRRPDWGAPPARVG